MSVVRWAAAAVTILMSLMNLPFVVTDGDSDFPLALNAAISLLGVVGIVSAIGLLRRAAWGRPAVLVIGAINLAGAIAASIIGMEGAFIGLVVSSLIVVLGLLTPGDKEPARLATYRRRPPVGQQADHDRVDSDRRRAQRESRRTHDARTYWRVALAMAAPLPWAAMGLVNILQPFAGDESFASTVEKVRDNLGLVLATSWMSLPFFAFLIPSVLAVVAATRRYAPRLAAWGGTLTVVGFGLGSAASAVGEHHWRWSPSSTASTSTRWPGSMRHSRPRRTRW